MHRNKKIWFLLLLIFVGPILAAGLLYLAPSIMPTNNKGQLIIPVRPVGQILNLKRSWYLIYAEAEECGDLCRNNLYKMQQIRLALGKDMKRVQRVIITVAGKPNDKLVQTLQHQYLGTQHIQVSPATFKAFLTGSSAKNSASSQSNFYLVDPMGNLMMRYPPTQTPKGIYSDLKRLLSVSQMG